MQAFYFIVVVWGKQYSDYLTDYCIPSLLAPNNIPQLEEKNRNKFLICTTKNDWAELQKNSSIIQLKKFLAVELVEIPPRPADVSNCQHMGIGHKLATEICFKDKAYGIALTPDLLVSDGSIAVIQQQAKQGKHAVMCAAIRFAEEPFFAGLEQLGIKKQQSEQTELVVSGRQLIQLCLKSFHSETETYDFESRNYKNINPVTLWRMENQQGLLIHSLSWCPMLIDYGAMQEHDTSALEQWTMDGDYIHKNLKNHDKIYVCCDSDEMMIISWSPLKYQALPLKSRWIEKFFKKYFLFRNKLYLLMTLENPIFDPLKLKLFSEPVYWHTQDLNRAWIDKEKTITYLLENPPSYSIIGLHKCLYNFFYYGQKIIKYLFITVAGLFSKKARKYLFHRIHVFLNSRKAHVTH